MTIASLNNNNFSSYQTSSRDISKVEQKSDIQVETNLNSNPEQELSYSKEMTQKAIDSINEFLEVEHKSSKFVFHEGLDKYFVRLVDSETEEVIKEIPPEKLLDAYYEMQKMLGMIVDEKI